MVMVSDRDKGVSARTPFVLVLVLSFPWSCRGLSCQGAEWLEDGIQDLESSWTALTNATLTLQSAHSSVDRNACESLCCETTQGNCTTTGQPLQSNINNGTCYLYSCAPAAPFCVFTTANGSDAVLTSLPLEKARRTSRILPSTATAIVGDGTQSKGRKGVLSESVDDLPLKHDNTTVKPRKGVLKEHSVNGRKGVGKDSLDISPELFSDEPLTTNSSVETNTSSQSTGFGLVEDVTNEIHTVLNAANTTTTKDPKGFDYTRNFTELLSEDNNITIVLLDNSTQRSQPLEAAPFSDATEPPNTRTVSTVPLHKSTVLSVIDMTNPDTKSDEVKGSVITQNVADLNWEAYQSNTAMHLVIGLVLGLMVLLTVIGVVAKRIHDSWQRRHYHRMDFLIDGMYHGNP